MNTKDLIIETTIKLIEKDENGLKNVKIRDIENICNISVGLVNYHFSSKDDLIKVAVEKIVNGIVYKFSEIRDEIVNLSPIDKLDFLGNLTLDYLFSHYQISRISILSDIENPSLKDNTYGTYKAFIPLVQEIRKDLSLDEAKMLALKLILFMQQSFIRHDIILKEFGIDLKNIEERKSFHHKMILDILGLNK